MFPVKTEQLGATGTAVQTGTPPETTKAVILTASQATGRVTLDGTTPGAATGHTIPLNNIPVVVPLAAPGGPIKFVSVTGATGATGAAILDITYLQA